MRCPFFSLLRRKIDGTVAVICDKKKDRSQSYGFDFLPHSLKFLLFRSQNFMNVLHAQPPVSTQSSRHKNAGAIHFSEWRQLARTRSYCGGAANVNMSIRSPIAGLLVGT